MTESNRWSASHYRFAAATLTILAAILYTYRLGKTSLWTDESASFVFARLSWHDLGVAVRSRDVFFTGYYSLLHLWMSFGSNEAVLRMPSVIAAVIALPCMYALGSRMFGPRAGLVAMMLLGSNNLFILHVREARPYAWLVLVAILSSLMFLRVLDSRKPSDVAWYVAASVFGIYVHIFAFLVPISHGVSLVFFPGKRPWKPFVFALAAITAMMVPLLILTSGEESASGCDFAGHGNPRDLIYFFRIFCGSKTSAVLYAALGAGVYLRYRLQRSRAVGKGDLPLGHTLVDPDAYSYAFLLCWMLVPPCVTLVVSHFVPLFKEIYLLVSLSPLLLLVAATLASIRDARIVVVATLLFVTLNIPGALKTYQDHGEKEDWRGAIAAVTEGARSHDALMILPATDTTVLAYYERNLAPRNLPSVVYPDDSAYLLWFSAPTANLPHKLIVDAFTSLPACSTSAPPLRLSRIRTVVHQYARVWMIVDQDVPTSAVQAESLAHMLADRFKLVKVEPFTRVVVKLYERA